MPTKTDLIPFTDHNPCGPMSGHHHLNADENGWVVCETNNIKFRPYNPFKLMESGQCYNAEHTHGILFGYAICQTGREVALYWAVSPQARVEQNARSMAVVTGSIGSTAEETETIPWDAPAGFKPAIRAHAEYIRPEHVIKSTESTK